MSAGHIRKRGTTWSYWLDLGLQPAQRCDSRSCARMVTRQGKTVVLPKIYWLDGGKGIASCLKCGAALRGVQERRQKTEGGFSSKRAAADAYTIERNRILQGGDPFPADMTLGAFSERWLAHHASRIRSRTCERYRGLLRDHLLPSLGALVLSRIRPAHVQRALDEMARKGLAPRTIIQARAVLGSAMRQAVAWGLVPVNPVTAVRPPKPERPELEVPNEKQLSALLKAAKGIPWEIPVLLSVSTGMRRSEVLAVRWADVDLDTSRLRITRTLQRVSSLDAQDRVAFVDPKTDRSRREIALPAFAVEGLRLHHREQAKRRLALGPGWRDLDLVCEGGDGGPLHPDAFSKAFKRIAGEAGLPRRTRLHDVRHGVATTMLGRGVHPAIASAVLGHASPAFTMAVYQHVLDGMTSKAADAIQEALAGSS